MTRALSYKRPANLFDAKELILKDDHVPLAGGTILNANDDSKALNMVDLQDLNLNEIKLSDGVLQLGAMSTLDEIMNHGDCPEGIRRAAQAEMPSTLRTLATAGGTVATADPDSTLLASFLVYEAEINLLGEAGELAIPVNEILENLSLLESQIILSIKLHTEGSFSFESTARTPADTPIVSVTALSSPKGLKVAATGVADTPILVDPTEPTKGLDPAGDFRGSPDYRIHLTSLLAARTLTKIGNYK